MEKIETIKKFFCLHLHDDARVGFDRAIVFKSDPCYHNKILFFLLKISLINPIKYFEFFKLCFFSVTQISYHLYLYITEHGRTGFYGANYEKFSVSYVRIFYRNDHLRKFWTY